MEGDPFARGRGDDHRRLRPSAPSRATSTCAASTPWPGAGWPHAIDAAPRAAACSGDDVHGPRRPLRHRALRRRRRLHLRRGDGDLQLDRGLPGRAAQQAAVPRRGRPVRPADAGQQRRDAGQRAAHRARRRGRLRRRRARRARPARSCSACPAASRGPASTRCRSAPRCASCSTWPAASPGGRPLQAVLLGGAAGAFVGPTSSTSPLTFEGTRATAPRSAPAW